MKQISQSLPPNPSPLSLPFCAGVQVSHDTSLFYPCVQQSNITTVTRKQRTVDTISNMEWPQLKFNTLMCVHVCTLFRERTCSDLAIYIYISFWLLYQTEFLCFMLSSIKISLDIPLNEERLMGKQKKHKPEMIQTSDLLKTQSSKQYVM